MRRTKDKKKSDYLRWQKSGKSKHLFCKEEGIGYHTFLKDCELFSEYLSVGFSRVEPAPIVKEESKIEIFEPNGRRVLLPVNTPLPILLLLIGEHARA